MRIEHTPNPPILLKLIPETPLDGFRNEKLSVSLSKLEIEHKIEGSGTVVLSINSGGHTESDEHEELLNGEDFITNDIKEKTPCV